MNRIKTQIQAQNVHNNAFCQQKRLHMWAAFSGRLMMWPSIRGTRREVLNDYRDVIERSGYDIRRVTVIQGKW